MWGLGGWIWRQTGGPASWLASLLQGGLRNLYFSILWELLMSHFSVIEDMNYHAFSKFMVSNILPVFKGDFT